MINSKLIRILKTFSPNEWKEFKKFSESPYFNKGRNYSLLLKNLQKFYPDFSSDKLSKEFLYKNIFPGKVFRERVITVLLSGLNSLAEKFLMQKEFEVNLNEQNKSLNAALLKRQLLSTFESNYKSSKKILEQEGLRNNEYWYYKYTLEKQKYERLMMDEKSRYLFDDSFLKFESDLDLYILHELCRFYQPALDQNFEFSVPYNYKHLDFILKEIEEHYDNSPQTLQCYYLYFNLIITREKNFADRLLMILEKTEDSFGNFELRNFYITVANFLGYSYMKGESTCDEYFKIIELMNNKNYLLKSNGYLEPNSLRNLVKLTTGKDLDKARDFIESNYRKLDPDIMENVYNFCYGEIHRKQNKYESALEFFAKIKPDSFAIKVDTELNRLVILYDLKQFESALSLCDSFSRYIRNHREISEIHDAVFLEFLKNYKTLISLSEKKITSDELDLFRREVESGSNMFAGFFNKRIDKLNKS